MNIWDYVSIVGGFCVAVLIVAFTFTILKNMITR